MSREFLSFHESVNLLLLCLLKSSFNPWWVLYNTRSYFSFLVSVDAYSVMGYIVNFGDGSISSVEKLNLLCLGEMFC